jgi:SPP1 gp7 family putative phage head morphogenesis protein
VADGLTFNQELLQAMVRHQVGLLHYSAGVRNKIWKLLDASEADVRRQIEDRLRREVGKAVTPARLERVNRLLESLRETRARSWKDVNTAWFDEMRDLAVAESGFTAGILQTVVPVDLGLALPDPTRLRSIVEVEPFMGATLKDWAEQIREADITRIEQQIRIGLVQGESVRQISRRVTGTVRLEGTDGVTAITRRGAESITRTATNSIAAASRRELFLANADLMDQELFTATLDSRTTPICRSLDGKLYPVGKAPRLPLHFGERSVISPVINGEVVGQRPVRNFTQKQLLREFAEQKGIKAPAKRASLPKGTKGEFDAFARKRMRELTGQAPAKLSYQEWLKGQPARFQDDILGPTRGELFRKGNLTLDRFVAPSGRELTLAELASFDADAFRAAGFDPVAFTSGTARVATRTTPKIVVPDPLPDLPPPRQVFGSKSQEYADAYDAWKAELTPEEFKTLRDWQGSLAYRSVRAAETGDELLVEAIGPEGVAKGRAIRDRMYQAIGRAPHVRDVQLFRGLDLDPDQIANITPGSVIELDALSSWSRSRKAAREFGSVVYQVKSGRSFDLSRLGASSMHADEAEHLILKGARFRVSAVKPQRGGGLLVELEEI